MRRHNISVVLDVGANDGDYAREIRDAGYRGKIVSFEPGARAFARLQQAAARDSNWDVYRLGLGDEPGKLDLHVDVRDVFSSFKRPSEFGRFRTAEACSESVEVVRLDAFLANHPEYLNRTYLKIDTQGFEMEVLRGTGSVLQDLAAIQAELGLLRIYHEQEDWLSVVMWMRERGFEVATSVCNAADTQQAQIIELDMVFTKRAA